MGTSTGYKGSTGGNWPAIKRKATLFAQGDGADLTLDPQAPPEHDGPELPEWPSTVAVPLPAIARTVGLATAGLLAAYVGGLRSRSAGGGDGSAGGGASVSRTVNPSVVHVGQRLGGFASGVASAGLPTALGELDLADLVGKPADELLDALVDRLADPGSTMDDHLARRALVALWNDLLADAVTGDDVEGVIRKTVPDGDVGPLLLRFYGHYLYEQFDRDFYEHWEERVGPEKARVRMKEVKVTIFTALRARVAGRDPRRVKWNAAEGARLAESILDEMFQIFEESE